MQTVEHEGEAAQTGRSSDSKARRTDPVKRRDLIRSITEDLSHKRLVLVVAPAGYGKTTALRQLWREFDDAERICVWVGLTPTDTNPVRFAASLNAACAQADDELEEISDVHSAKHLATSASVSIAYLAERIEKASREVIFFIDEYHVAQNPEIDTLLADLIRETRTNVRYVVTSRSTPACGAAKMRLDDALAEYTQESLSFSIEEIDQLFEERLSPFDVRMLAAKTEGWPAGLRMAKLWLSDNGYPEEPIQYFTGAMHTVSAYFAEEVFNEFPEDLQKFLCETSVLPSFNADIADAVLGRRDSAQILRRLDDMNAFVTLVDPRRQLYRHHSLFADFLRQRLTASYPAAEIVKLHQRAAKHFADSGDNLRALHHAIETDDHDVVASILGDSDTGLCRLTADINTFTHLMDRLHQKFPETIVRLLPTQAFYLIKRSRLKEAKLILDKTQEMLNDKDLGLSDKDWEETHADHLLIDVVYQIYADKPNCDDLIARLQDSSVLSYSRDPMYKGIINNLLSMLLRRRGRIKEAEQGIERTLSDFDRAQSHFSMIYNYLHRGMLDVLKADIRGAQESYGRANEVLKRHLPRHNQLAAMIDIGRAECCYETGELEAADGLLSRALPIIIEDGDYWVEVLSRAYRLGAKIKYATSGLEPASYLLTDGLGLAREREFPRLQRSLWAQQIHLAAIADDFDVAERIVADNGLSLESVKLGDELDFGWCEETYLAIALIRLHLSRGRADEAIHYLRRLEQLYAPTSLNWFDLKFSALEALASYVDDRRTEAAEQVRSVVLAGQEAGVRGFLLEEGRLAQQLLEEAGSRYMRAARGSGEITKTIVDWLVTADSFQPTVSPLVAPDLTQKQRRILLLVAQGLKRPEIAKATNTTIHNVAYHLAALFELFNVANTTQLLAKAMRLGITNEQVVTGEAR